LVGCLLTGATAALAVFITADKSTESFFVEIVREFRGFVNFVVRAVGPDLARTCHYRLNAAK
jgi:hypothetical protein